MNKKIKFWIIISLLVFESGIILYQNRKRVEKVFLQKNISIQAIDSQKQVCVLRDESKAWYCGTSPLLIFHAGGGDK